MNQRSQVVLEVIKNERTFSMNIPFGSSYEECLEVADLYLKQLQVMKAQADAKEAEAAKAS